MQFKRNMHYHSHIRSELIEMLPLTRGRFLEIGCGTGGTLDLLKQRGAIYTAGVDINAESIKMAADKGLDSAIVADIEKDDLPYREKEFDGIILADVLEHLYDPWNTLKKITNYIADDGYILISLPNIKYYKVLRRLMFHDEWTYDDAGILDITHIRFFTLTEIYRLLKFSGLKCVRIKKQFVSSKKMKMLNKLFFCKLDNFFSYQFYILAKKVN
jgi:2-polyprenyl-3-methyl-5-hydroxy-6-metoxy-1,4-benzoquinol methylase